MPALLKFKKNIMWQILSGKRFKKEKKVELLRKIKRN